MKITVRSLAVMALLLFVPLVLPQNALAELTFPQGDFSLYLGVIDFPADPSALDYDNRALFNSSYVTIKDGKVSASDNVPVTYDIGTQHFTASARLTMNGAYDKSDGMMSGTFTYNIDENYTQFLEGYNATSTGKGTIDASGSFSGQIVEDKAVIKFKGVHNIVIQDQRPGHPMETVQSTSAERTLTVAYRVNEAKTPVEEEKPEMDSDDEQFLENGKPVDSGARFSGLNGQVEIHIPGTPAGTWKLLDLDDPIPRGSRIRTQEDSSAVIGFADMGTFVLKPESEIIILTPPEKDSKIKLVAGNVWVNIKKMIKDGSMEIEMNQAVAGIKGTTLIASEANGISSVKMIEGKIAFKSIKTGEVKEVTGGQEANVKADGAIAAADYDVAAELGSWDKLLPASLKQVEQTQQMEPTQRDIPAAKSPEAESFNVLPYAGIGAAVLAAIGLIIFLKKKSSR